nr:MAG TPA: hypothetical protein [Caudoviricetes sp.]
MGRTEVYGFDENRERDDYGRITVERDPIDAKVASKPTTSTATKLASHVK